MLKRKRSRVRKCELLLVFLVVLNINFASCVEAPQIQVPGHGIIVGTYLKMFRTHTIKAYLGIPYAEAERFSPPDVGAVKWNGILNATSFAPDCWQKPSKPMSKETEYVFKLLNSNRQPDTNKNYNENCLHLNIFIPDGSRGTKGYAVIVWIQGRDFSHGSPSDINPFQLVFKQKVIVVTISYRLSIFGFLSTGDGEAQGNFGLMDQAAALFWIRKNINHFNGDENQITIMGHSAGAISVGIHMIAGEWSKNAFTKAIIMSGNPLSENAVKTSKEYTNSLDSIANIFQCPRRPTSLLINCLKDIDARSMIDNIPLVDWGPVIDYGLSNKSFHFIEDYPIIRFNAGSFSKVPVLIGITDIEDALDFIEDTETKKTNQDFVSRLNDMAESDVKKNFDEDMGCNNVQMVVDALNYAYRNSDEEKKLLENFVNFHVDRLYVAPMYQLADIISESGVTYAYLFNFKPKTSFYSLPKWVGVPRYFDQIFVWGAPYMDNYNFIKEWDSADKKISDIVMTMWANFAKTSNPTNSSVYVKWNPYTSNNQSILIINENFTSKALDNTHITHFWNNYYPKVVKFAIDCCNVTNTTTKSFLHPLYIYIFALMLISRYS